MTIIVRKDILMLSRVALLVAGLLLAGTVAGVEKPHPSLTLICPYQTAMTRGLAVHGDLDAPPAINTLIVNVIDGKLPQVRRQLDAMSPADAAHWRQSVLVIAAYARNSAMVAGLLDNGALVDGQGTLPGLNRKVRDQLMAEVKKDPKWATVDPEPKTGRLLDTVLLFDGRPDGPVATIAAQCGDLATLDVALDHHANVKARIPHSNDVMVMAVTADNPAIVKRLLDHGADPSRVLAGSSDGLIAAIVDGNATMVKLLLDHGADPCVENRSRQQRLDAYRAKHPGQKRPLVSDAELGRRRKLPEDLVARLTCPTFDMASAHKD
jgi:hypothetical protein